MSEKANPAGGHVSTADRNGLTAVKFRLDAAEFGHGLLDSLPRAIAVRRGGCMLYDKLAIFDHKQLSHLSRNTVFDIAYFDMNRLMRDPAIPLSMH